MFKKIDFDFGNPIYIVTHGLKTFTGIENKGIDYKKIWSPDEKQIYSIIPKKYWPDFHLTIMTINTRIPPHTDTEILTTINFYIETNNCRTVFYEPTVNNPKSFKIENQTDGCIYYDEELKEVSSFIAQPKDVWLLDVKKIHSVEPLGEIKMRKAITLGSHKHNFDDVCNMLMETSSI